MSVTVITLSPQLTVHNITELVTTVLTLGAVKKQLCCTHLNETFLIIKPLWCYLVLREKLYLDLSHS